jgi:hypothetical protein
VLVHARERDATPLVGMRRETLDDRFPLREPSEAQRGWLSAVQAIAANGAGCVLFRSGDSGATGIDAVDCDLLARHAPARARLLPGDYGETLGAELTRRGVDVEPDARA